MEVFLPIAQVFVNPVEILLLSAIVGILSGLFGVGGGFLMTPFLIFLGVPTHIQLKAQILDWIGSSSLFIFLMLLPSRLDSNSAKQDSNLKQIYPELFRLIPKAALVAVMCFFIRESIREELKDFASLVSLVMLSVLASLFTEKSLKRDAIKLSSLVFLIYAAAVGMLFQVEKLASLSKLEILYPIVLIAVSYLILNLLGRFIAAQKKLSMVVVSSSVLSPMIAALIISKLRGEDQIPLSLRLSIIGLLSACFYTFLIQYVISML